MVFGGNQQRPDPDDYFSDTRMSFGDHLEDLRTHLWRAIAGFCVALVFGFFLGKPAERFIAAPVERQLQAYWANYHKIKKAEILEDLRSKTLYAGDPTPIQLWLPKSEDKQQAKAGKPDGKLDLAPAFQSVFGKHGLEESEFARTLPANYELKKCYIGNPLEIAINMKDFEPLVGRKPALATMSVQEGFMVYFQVSIVCGLILSSPWIFYQIWSFVAAGLYPHEKRHVNVFLPFSIGLFLAGVAICEFIAIPSALEALLWFNQWLGLEPNFRLSEWLSFALLMPIVFGASFQTPLVMLFLERIGIFTVESFRHVRKYAWFAMVLFAAIINPSSDYTTLFSLWLPMCVLYEVGILLCVYFPRQPSFDTEASQTEELVEV